MLSLQASTSMPGSLHFPHPQIGIWTYSLTMTLWIVLQYDLYLIEVTLTLESTSSVSYFRLIYKFPYLLHWESFYSGFHGECTNLPPTSRFFGHMYSLML